MLQFFQNVRQHPVTQGTVGGSIASLAGLYMGLYLTPADLIALDAHQVVLAVTAVVGTAFVASAITSGARH